MSVKPTTGEWTVERIHSYKCDGDLIADINAELAAEREKHRVKTTEYAKGWDDHVLASRSVIQQLREQLAAAVEALKQIAANKLGDDNCASVELAGKRVANIAKAALAKMEEGKLSETEPALSGSKSKDTTK